MNLVLPGNAQLGTIAKVSDYLPEDGVLARRIEKYGRAKQRSLQMLAYLEEELRRCPIENVVHPSL